MFDAVFSNATLHWCKRDPAAVIKAAKSVLKDGGRFVGEMGGLHNCIGESRQDLQSNSGVYTEHV